MILDTNALSAFFDNDEAAVAMVREAEELAIPEIVAGEFALVIAQPGHRSVYERSLQRMPVA